MYKIINPVSFSFLLCLVVYLSLSQSVFAGGKKYSSAPAWPMSTPPPDHYDWIQLNSGEWLKGELEVLYNKKLEFDSDELDLLSLDWGDVYQVRGHGLHSVKFEFMPTVVGNLQVKGDEVIMTYDGKKFYYKRDQIVSIAYGEPKEKNYWSAKIKLGFNIKSGNISSKDFDSTTNIKRRTSNSRFTFEYIGVVKKTESIETENNHRVSFNYDIYSTRDFFWRPIFGEFFTDSFQNIDYRASAGVGVGYFFIYTPKTEFEIGGGPSYLTTKFDTVEAGQAIKESTPALVFTTDYNTELNKKLDFIAGFKMQIGNQASGGYTHQITTTLETELTKRFDFDVTMIWNRISNPRAGADGLVPEKDDYRLVISLVLDI